MVFSRSVCNWYIARLILAHVSPTNSCFPHPPHRLHHAGGTSAERLAAQGQRLYATFAARSGAPRRNAGREALPPPRDAERRSRHSHAERGNEPGRGDEALLRFVADELSAGRSDVVHDLLAFLAEQMIALHQERQRLQRADDPFKWLDRAAPVDKLERVLRDEITYGERVASPLLDQPHDLDGLRLTPSPSGWLLEAQLKLREVDDPKQWQKEANGRDIAREWVAVYRFAGNAISEAKARFYRYGPRSPQRLCPSQRLPRRRHPLRRAKAAPHHAPHL